MECPRCGCISLAYQRTTDRAPYIETWHCDTCGHTECFHIAEPVKDTTDPAFDAWVAKMGGCDWIDSIGKVEGMRIAFLAGISAWQDKEIARLERNISLLQRQAE